MAVNRSNTRRAPPPPPPPRGRIPSRAAAKPGRPGTRYLGKVRKRRASMPIKQQLLLTGFCVALLAAALPTALLLSLALLPAICALLVDRGQGRYAALSVGALNIAGTWPFLLKLWSTGHSVANAMKIIMDPFAWLIIYSAAAVGWVVYLSFPSFVSVCMSFFSGHRLTQLRQHQKKLVDEWGPDVANHHVHR